MTERRLLYDVVAHLAIGNLALRAIELSDWGSRISCEIVYRYPPQERLFRLGLSGCRGIEWYISKNSATLAAETEAQLLTHDLGADQYQRPARFATTLIEVIVSYERLLVEER